MSSPTSPYPQGTLWTSVIVAASGAFWGLWWIPLRFLESHGLVGNWASVILNAAATLVLLPIVILRSWPSRQDLGPLLVVGLLAGFTFATWNHALLYGAVVRVTVKPLRRIEEAHWAWHVGLDAESTAILNALWSGEEVEAGRMRNVLALFAMQFAEPAALRPEVAGRTVYLALSANAELEVRMKPQNLLTGLPLHEA